MHGLWSHDTSLVKAPSYFNDCERPYHCMKFIDGSQIVDATWQQLVSTALMGGSQNIQQTQFQFWIVV